MTPSEWQRRYDADLIEAIAQNDHMIDQYMLPTGERLLEISARIRANYTEEDEG